ncbi:hypothetical protein [Pseudoalteromonas luteoviolacea]|uniref:hypothetical protein n=1 Tax=Pseudoalteromonas luteoviolacea TaxID=43657 RepID=UPI0011546498|nr:hypothetical protein [Pseudoalteromonas luteoviolacea]TQF71226.1 hypothetical protein FLM44_09080 [Pseudoalteromonas luteoviolacea]
MIKKSALFILLVGSLTLVFCYFDKHSKCIIESDTATVKQISHALYIYHKQLGHDLEKLSSLQLLVDMHPALLYQVPLDKWNSPFEYRFISHSPLTFMIFSSGSVNENQVFTFYIFKETHNGLTMTMVES